MLLVDDDEIFPVRVAFHYDSLAESARLRYVSFHRGSSRADDAEAVIRLPTYAAHCDVFLTWDRPEMKRLDLERRARRRKQSYRHLTDAFLQEIATEYAELEASGETALCKTLAKRHGARAESTALRWVREAESRGIRA